MVGPVVSCRRLPGSLRTGFTFIEVLILLMVISVGLTGVIGLIVYGSRLASKAQAETIAMATAISVANDPRPMLDAAMAGEWSYTPYDFDNNTGTLTSTARGYVNGLYLRRVETTTPADIIARSAIDGLVYARSALVEVDAFETVGGSVVTSYVKRIVRQRAAP